MATELTKKITATLSNSYNSSAVAYQGCYSSTSSKGATATNRIGYFQWSGLSELKGKKINQIIWSITYASTGNDAKKTLNFTTPSASFTSGVSAYGNSETRTLDASTNSAFYESLISAINGTGSVKWTLNNSETTTTINASSSGSYSKGYLQISSSYITVYYEEKNLPKYYNGSTWVEPKNAYYYNGSSWQEIANFRVANSSGTFVPE